MDSNKKKHYVQFSKRIVVAVTIAVTIVILTGITMAFLAQETAQITAMVKVYVEYAMVVFAAYSGNSAVQKWIVAKAKQTTDDDEESSNG